MKFFNDAPIVVTHDFSATRSLFDSIVIWPDVITSQVYSGLDFVYSFGENILAYDFSFLFLSLLSTLTTDSPELFFWCYWFFSFNFSGFQLFWSIFLDEYVGTFISKLPYDESWYRLLLASQDGALLFVYHPEALLLKEGIKNSFLNPYVTTYFTPIFSLLTHDSILLPVMLLPQFILVIMLIALGISFYFAYFTTANKEENLIDQDYMLANITIEAEEEIASWEDLIIVVVVVAYIFGWFFFINFWLVIGQHGEFLLVYALLPFLYVIIIGIPVLLIYDFGIFFIAYLKGVGPSASLFMELVYDYIALVAFFIRLCVQGVRLLLMLFTYAGLHELILFYSINPKFLLGYDTIWEEINNIEPTIRSLTFFLLCQLPARIGYWIYELAHMFFVITAQFIAFFAMVLWLFFFYTHFLFTNQLKDFLLKNAN